MAHQCRISTTIWLVVASRLASSDDATTHNTILHKWKAQVPSQRCARQGLRPGTAERPLCIEGTSIEGTSIEGTSIEGHVQLWFRLALLLQLIKHPSCKTTACALAALAERLFQPLKLLLELNLHPFARRRLTASWNCELTAFYFLNILTIFCSGLIKTHSFICNFAITHWNRLTCCHLVLHAGGCFKTSTTKFPLLQCGWQCIAVCRVMSDVWSAVSAWHAAALPLLPWTCTRIVTLAICCIL